MRFDKETFYRFNNDYEIKIIYKGHLVRSIKFAVDGEGKLVDNGIGSSNKLGNKRIIVPVTVLGDSDGRPTHFTAIR